MRVELYGCRYKGKKDMATRVFLRPRQGPYETRRQRQWERLKKQWI